MGGDMGFALTEEKNLAGLLRDVPFSAIYFPLCAGLKAHMIPFWHQQLHTSQSAGCTAAALAAGAVAGTDSFGSLLATEHCSLLVTEQVFVTCTEQVLLRSLPAR